MDEDLRSRFRVPNNHRFTQPSRRQLPSPSKPEVKFKLSQPKQPYATKPEISHKLSFEPPAGLKAKKPRKRLVYLVILILLIATVYGGKLWAYPKFSHHNPFPVAIKGSTSFPLYYPAKLPVGYKVDTSSFRTTSTEVVFYATKDTNRLVFTQQKIPSGFDFGSFYSRQISNSISFKLSYGSGVVGKNDVRNMGSFVTDKTWILLTTNSVDVSTDDMQLVLKSLKQY